MINWQNIQYNFRWSDFNSYIDGWIPKFSLFVPLLGYMLLFNDLVAEHFSFEELTNENELKFGLTGIERLRLIYFGMIFLGVSNFIYRIRRPYVFRHGRTDNDFILTGLDVFTLPIFRQMHEKIQNNGNLTIQGMYSLEQWTGFEDEALFSGSRDSDGHKGVNWKTAVEKHGSLLRSILAETFFKEDKERQTSLLLCVILSTSGYICLIAPGLDVFVKVTYSVFLDIWS